MFDEKLDNIFNRTAREKQNWILTTDTSRRYFEINNTWYNMKKMHVRLKNNLQLFRNKVYIYIYMY